MVSSAAMIRSPRGAIAILRSVTLPWAMSTMQAVLCLVWDRVFMMTKRPSGLTVQLFCTYPSVSLEKLQCESPGRDTGLPLNRHPPSCVHTRDVFAQEMSSDS